METYRKVLCSERLPDREKYYWTSLGSTYFHIDRGENGEFEINVDSGQYVTFWLEEIQQPTVGEIALAIRGKCISDDSARAAAQAIHRLYGGEEKKEGGDTTAMQKQVGESYN